MRMGGSKQEAAVAAAEFVKRADHTGDGSIDGPTMERALRPSGFHGGRRMSSSYLR